MTSNIDRILERIMYNKFCTFLEKKQPTYSCKFGFRQKHSTIHALIHLTEKISNQLHCVKSVRIRSFSGPYFPAFGLNTERKSISPYSVGMRENTDQNKVRQLL